jgi:hypothetical protein
MNLMDKSSLAQLLHCCAAQNTVFAFQLFLTGEKP